MVNVDQPKPPTDIGAKIVSLMRLQQLRTDALNDDLEVYRVGSILTDSIERARRLVWAQEMIAIEAEIQRLAA